MTSPADSLKPGNEIEIMGKVYTLLFKDIGSLWMVCLRDDPDAEPVLKAL